MNRREFVRSTVLGLLGCTVPAVALSEELPVWDLGDDTRLEPWGAGLTVALTWREVGVEELIRMDGLTILELI